MLLVRHRLRKVCGSNCVHACVRVCVCTKRATGDQEFSFTRPLSSSSHSSLLAHHFSSVTLTLFRFESNAVRNWSVVGNMIRDVNYAMARLPGDIYVSVCTPAYPNLAVVGKECEGLDLCCC
jgi:hypothetical protein